MRWYDSLMPTDEAKRAQSGGRASGAADRTPVYPEPVDRLIEHLAKLPGIGRRSAERLAFHLLKSEPSVALELARAMRDVKQSVKNCRVCANLTDRALCAVCEDPRRDRGMVLVVEQPRDLIALEQTGMYRGVYHVLLGRLSPLDGIGADELTIGDLLARAKSPERNPGGAAVREVILGLNPTLEGDGTALFLAEELKGLGVKVSRLARGLPAGSQLEYANRAVLADAISGRQSMEG